MLRHRFVARLLAHRLNTYPFSFRAFRTFSAVIGNEVIRTPTASATALAIAAAVGIKAVSPMLMLLYGPLPKSDCRMVVSSGGISLILGILYSPRLLAKTLPLS